MTKMYQILKDFIVRPVMYVGLTATVLTGCYSTRSPNYQPTQQLEQRVEENYITNFGEKPLKHWVMEDQSRVALGDMDGDGDLDIVIAKFDRVIVIENRIPQKDQQ